MTILTSANGSLPLTLRKGETLVIRNYSGTETVAGSTVAREDVSSTTGSGAIAYGPQTSAATLTLSSSGSLDYQVVSGDLTPAVSALISQPTGQIVTPSGEVVGGGAGLLGVRLTHPMTTWRKRLARCASGGILTRITVFGDSNIGGTGAGVYYNEAGVMQNTGTFGVLGGYPYSLSQVMRDRLVARYGCAFGESFFGDQGMSAPGAPVNYALIDPRVTYGAGWANATSKAGTGGSWHEATGATGGRMAFLPAQAWDFANVFSVRFSSGCTDARIYADGAQKAAMTLAGGNALLKTQITADARKVQALQFEGQAGGVYIVVGAECYEAGKPGLIVRQLGNAGATSGASIAAGNPWECGAFHRDNPGNLSIIYSTINDVLALTPAQYKANIQTWANRCVTNGEDMLWVGCFPADDPQTTNGGLDSLKAAAAEVLNPLGVNMIDLRDYMGSTWAEANSAGYMFDARHPNRAGHSYIGQIIAEAIGA